jgi:3-deoxy-manno-octulosonate cytidylyltransferase (CMP-KDO synthetase)
MPFAWEQFNKGNRILQDIVNKTIIIIPARMESTRLPDKPLAMIGDKPMILHVLDLAKKSGVGAVYVAAAEEEIARAVRDHGGNAILTDPAHASGTDRIFEALESLKDHRFEYIINLQGDLPYFDPQILLDVLAPLASDTCDIATLAAKITDMLEVNNVSNVKIALTKDSSTGLGQAHYFSRHPIPHGATEFYHHVGIYAYKIAALRRFIAAPLGQLEDLEKLEQLRALENNMYIAVKFIDSVPISVDTAEDLEFARRVMRLGK